MRLIGGLDLGQSADHSALCLVERVRLDQPRFRRRHQYVIRLLDEYPLGVSYTDQVGRVVKTLSHDKVRGASVAVDYTGVGRPVFDLLRDARPPVVLYPLLTTSGHSVTHDRETREYHVPKSQQVALLQVLLQADLLTAHPKLPTAARLRDQLARFRVKITKAKNEVFGAESGTNDDLVSAVMLAVWLGEHVGGGDPSAIRVGGGSGESAAASAVDTAPPGVFLP